jgi:hypothetical protein
MIHRIARIFFIAILITALVFPPTPALACGPDFTGPLFFSTTGPEIPYADYARGRLELLQHTYWHEPLYIAYRNLSGRPLSEAEVQALQNSWQHNGQDSRSQSTDNSKPKDWIAEWRALRAQTLGKPEGNSDTYYDDRGIIRVNSRDNGLISYYNCLQDAFQTAVHTALNRKKEFGVESPFYKEWIAAQDQVFENCSGSSGYPSKQLPKPVVLPAAARVEDPPSVRADRAYQIAAAYFYAGEFSAARSAFEQIAKDSSSPYRKIAPYLVARVLIRSATITESEDQFDVETMSQAEKQLHAVLTDKESAEFHEAAKRLLGFVRIRLHPQERLQELETVLLEGKPTTTWGQDLTDYLWLLDHPVSIRAAVPGQTSEIAIQAEHPFGQATRLKSGDMTDWILTFQQTSEDAFQHSLQRWQETKSLPWLVAAIGKVPASDKTAADLSAAAKIPADSPAYLTVTFHRLRILEQSGNADTARQQLDQLLSQRGPALSFSAKNQFLALRMKLATSLQESLQFAPRSSNDAEAYPNPPDGRATPADATASHFDSDASVVLTEKLPLRMLAEAAKSPALPKPLRRDIVIAAWTRAILLDQETTARELVPTAQELVPEAASEFAEYYRIMEVPPLRFAAVLAILRNPGFRPFITAGYPRGNLYTVGEPRFDRIDDLHDNWWCSLTPNAENQSYGRDYYRMFINLSSPLREIYPDGKIPPPSFLAHDDRAIAAKEQSELAAQLAAPNWLGKRALVWANAHPDDARVPEALHLVVRAWRYGCAESTGENYSKEAFELLHKRYPDSEWTKKTPYWFN